MPLTTPITRASTPSLHEPGIRALIFDEWELYVEEYKMLFQVQGSEKAQEHEVVLSGGSTFDLLAEGGQVTFDTTGEAYKKSFTHNQFARGFKVTKIARDDDLYGYVRQAARELGRMAKYTKNVQAMDTLNNATTTAIYTLNGVSPTLLSATHQRLDGGTWSNKFGSATDLAAESLEAALTQFETDMVDHRGRPQIVMPKYVAVGPSNRFILRRLLETKKGRPFSNNNDVNVLLDYDLEPVILHHMNDDGRWFLFAEKGQNGLRYWDRQGLSTVTDREPTTQNDLYMGFYRESHGATHGIGTYGSAP